ncbi:MAG: hypothetical protein MR288_01015 [Firmicutes bacterium]|nr:hypothetical protein [Bacillota bacterium]
MNCLYLSVLKRSRTYRIPMQVVGILECYTKFPPRFQCRIAPLLFIIVQG